MTPDERLVVACYKNVPLRNAIIAGYQALSHDTDPAEVVTMAVIAGMYTEMRQLGIRLPGHDQEQWFRSICEGVLLLAATDGAE